MQNLAPIALFVYNRPDHTRRTISYLQQNLLADESRLYIFCDAAKTDADKPKVEQVRQLVKDVSGFKSVKIILRNHNLGLAESIISGVTQLVYEYGKVIVFEDDLLSSPYTLQYFNDALTKYANQEQVMHIGAYMYNLHDKKLPETFFYRAATSWGWATWARAWKNFEPDVDKLIAQFDTLKIARFSIEGKMNFWKQIEQFKAGKNNSWAIRWYASIFLKNGLTLNPSQSLIQNIGHDGTGVHSNKEDMYHVQMGRKQVTQFPDTIEENEEAYKAIKNFLANRKGTLLQRIRRFMKQQMGR
ncbi:glycosyltransferase family 2 protein [Mucilaginibacter rubeus]|uniref:Glycosyltransferase n=1 Tax=Mucilaginibacter rubeus TaxID=2027860 RepID=A0AAE6JIL2_9SPHI|nr:MULTISPECIES: glycosyltransferase [Mucilaginibacter]QEM06341.1 glycosyltransferase family 2 protein [Mucilaginibacter rubeus]QEM18924.1 glycosyltransferase family 2 protein [Mucilaginibacter gossypii]QTE44534.1 glycosyltransferase [Mucilaginibacter rubeus]QTE51132.1 glycosyltransferase [Mucilaginibacter rubeus]QTE56218.1 glycosyltransferase [Mucilaginibacter rubeus]